MDSPPLGRPSYSRTRLPTQSLTIGVGGNYAKLRFRKDGQQAPRDWKRGQVQEFSARSRSRLLQMFARTDLRNYEQPCYLVTLTYHHDWDVEALGWKRDIAEYTRRMVRLFPDAWYVWRLEFQKRGTPHFHLMVFGVPEGKGPFLEALWVSIVHPCCKWCLMYLAKADLLQSWAQAGRYCSKYCAKIEKGEPLEPGRYWGVQHRASRPESLQSVEVTEDEAFKLRRIFRRIIRAANGYYKLGGPRSGVWVACSNETAKRALDSASSASEADTINSTTRLSVTPYGRDRPPGDSDPNNTSTPPCDLPNQTVRTTRKPNSPLFDARDVERRRAMALCA